MSLEEDILQNCLYFTTNSLSRVITKMADEEFMITGLPPSHAFLVMWVNSHPGVIQKDLAYVLNLAPSTVTRFLDNLARRGFLERRVEGKISRIYPTEKGQALQETIHQAWHNLYTRYKDLLGEEAALHLAHQIREASEGLGQNI